jgi:serine/threonine protein kinase
MNLTATGIVMGTALYVSPEQATGSPLTGSSDVYSLGVVAYECLSGEPPFMADQPLAIAIMHKHDPVTPLPPDVPRPVADLVYAMLAKTPDARPETAQHVADRAEIIRDARNRSGHSGPITADLPVVPNFPPADGNDFYNPDPERSGGSIQRRKGLLLAGAGLAACGIIAVIAVLLTSSAAPAAGPEVGTTPSGQSVSTAGTPATASVPVTPADGGGRWTNLGAASKTPTATSSARPTSSGRGSPTPTKSAPSKSTSPSAPATSSTAPPTTPPPTTAPPTTPPPTTVPPTTPPPTTVPPTGAPAAGPTAADGTEG